MRSFIANSILATCLAQSVASLVIERYNLAEELLKRDSSSQTCSSASKTPASTSYGKEVYSCITTESDGDNVSTNVTNTVKTLSDPLDQGDALKAISLVKSSVSAGTPVKIDYRQSVGDVAFSLHVCNTNADQIADTLKSGIDGLTALLPKTWQGKQVGQAVGFFTNSAQGNNAAATYVIGDSEYSSYSGAYTCGSSGPPTIADGA